MALGATSTVYAVGVTDPNVHRDAFASVVAAGAGGDGLAVGQLRRGGVGDRSRRRPLTAWMINLHDIIHVVNQ
jgi:hypothetical protein